MIKQQQRLRHEITASVNTCPRPRDAVFVGVQAFKKLVQESGRMIVDASVSVASA
jgi:hypothetical protein